jgi:hypothetical protein
MHTQRTSDPGTNLSRAKLSLSEIDTLTSDLIAKIDEELEALMVGTWSPTSGVGVSIPLFCDINGSSDAAKAARKAVSLIDERPGLYAYLVPEESWTTRLGESRHRDAAIVVSTMYLRENGKIVKHVK